jgi:uncharacterized membrane protein
VNYLVTLNHGFDGRFHHEHGGDFPFGLIFLLLLLVLVGLVVWSVLRPGGRHGPPPPPPGHGPGDAALEQARLRYARGEIDRDEFVRISRDLGSPVTAEDTG